MTTRDTTRKRMTTLYRLFDADGALLYIGIAGNPGRRFGQHGTNKTWWSQVATITLEHHPTRDAADAAERAAILAEQPLHNVAHHPVRVVGVVRRNGPYPTIVEAMTIDDVAEYTGTKRATIAHFHKQGQGGLPKPKAILAGRPIWERAQIDAWQARRRAPGRPATPTE